MFALLAITTLVTTTLAQQSVNTSALSITSCPSSPSVPGVNAALLAQFPPLTGPAQIVSGDTVARSLYQQITSNASWSSLLALAPKPYTRNAGASTAGYSASTDPDCWWTASGCVTPKSNLLPPDWNSCRTPETWGLTIDDGPSTEHCQLYQLLRDNKIEASLFYIGSNVVQFPAAAAEGFQAGHTICVHTWSHNYTSTLTNEQVFAEMYYLAIKRIVGVTPRCFRPPYGDVDDRVRVFAYALGMDVWLWNGETNDWASASGTSASTINSNFNKLITADHSTGGIVVLTHETTLRIASFFVDNFAKIAGAFDTIVSGHICNNITSPYGEPNSVTHPTFAQYVTGARTTGNLAATVNATAQVYLAGLGGSQPFANASSPVASNSASASGSSTASTASGSSPPAGSGSAAAAITGSKGMSTNMIATIVGSVAAGIVALVVLALLIMRYRSKKTAKPQPARIGSPQSLGEEKSPYGRKQDDYDHLASQSDLQVNTVGYYQDTRAPPVPPMPAHVQAHTPSNYRAW